MTIEFRKMYGRANTKAQMDCAVRDLSLGEAIKLRDSLALMDTYCGISLRERELQESLRRLTHEAQRFFQGKDVPKTLRMKCTNRAFMPVPEFNLNDNEEIIETWTQDDDPRNTVVITEQTLSDGSSVYAVLMGNIRVDCHRQTEAHNFFKTLIESGTYQIEAE